MKPQIAFNLFTFLTFPTTILIVQGLKCENCVELLRNIGNETETTGCINYDDFIAKTPQFNDLGYLPEQKSPVVCTRYTFQLSRGPWTDMTIIRMGLAKSDIDMDRKNLTDHGTDIEVMVDEVNVDVTCVSAFNFDPWGSRMVNWVQSCECATDLCNQDEDPIVTDEDETDTDSYEDSSSASNLNSTMGPNVNFTESLPITNLTSDLISNSTSNSTSTDITLDFTEMADILNITSAEISNSTGKPNSGQNSNPTLPLTTVLLVVLILLGFN